MPLHTSARPRGAKKIASGVEKVTAGRLQPQSPRRPKAALEPADCVEMPVSAVIDRARDMGLMSADTQHVGARLPMKLLDRAKKRTGLTSTTDLLAFALASVAVEDNFAAAFVAARGKLDPELDLGF